jgi:hypothetical protein
MLLAEELALVAVNPDTGRHGVGTRSNLNACLAGLLVAELMLEGGAAPGEGKQQIVLAGGPSPESPTLAAAAEIVDEKGPKLRAVLSHMSRGLESRFELGTWDVVVAGLVGAGALSPSEGGMRPKNDVVDHHARDAVIARLQAAATSDRPLDPRTGLLLSMTGPASLLEVVAPERGGRRHARRRIDHGLDGTEYEMFGKVVRKILADAAAAAGAAATGAAVAGGS